MESQVVNVEGREVIPTTVEKQEPTPVTAPKEEISPAIKSWLKAKEDNKLCGKPLNV